MKVSMHSQFGGRDAWIAAQTMMFFRNSGTPPIDVYVTRVPENRDSTLEARAFVAVGVASQHDGLHRLSATPIRDGGGWDIRASRAGWRSIDAHWERS
jgi:hypothetical protein